MIKAARSLGPASGSPGTSSGSPGPEGQGQGIKSRSSAPTHRPEGRARASFPPTLARWQSQKLHPVGGVYKLSSHEDFYHNPTLDNVESARSPFEQRFGSHIRTHAFSFAQLSIQVYSGRDLNNIDEQQHAARPFRTLVHEQQSIATSQASQMFVQ